MYSNKEKIKLSSMYGTQSKYYDVRILQKILEERSMFILIERRNHGEADKSRSNRKG